MESIAEYQGKPTRGGDVEITGGRWGEGEEFGRGMKLMDLDRRVVGRWW